MEYIIPACAVLGLFGTILNFLSNLFIKNKLLEFELNFRKELNGKYITLKDGERLEHRIEKLEEAR